MDCLITFTRINFREKFSYFKKKIMKKKKKRKKDISESHYIFLFLSDFETCKDLSFLCETDLKHSETF